MSNVIPIRNGSAASARAQEEACLWIVRLSAGLDGPVQAELKAWLAAHPEHINRLLDAAKVWDQLDVLAELSLVLPLDEYQGPRMASRHWKWPLALAASLVLGWSLYLLLPREQNTADTSTLAAAAPASAYETAIGEQLTVRLADGTELILNTNSRVEINFDSALRAVTLRRGEAHFNVAKDASRPFRVFANSGMVEAIGTAFAVQETLGRGLELVVVEGVVNFTPTVAVIDPALSSAQQRATAAPVRAGSALSAPISLAAGEAIQVDAADATVIRETVEPSEIEKRLAWRSGMLLFQGDPLEQVIREVSRYTSIRFEVDEAIKTRQVLGYFRTGDIDAMLITMRDTFGIAIERVNENHIILRAGQ